MDDSAFDKRIYLEFPNAESIQRAFLELPQYGRLEILCETNNIGEMEECLSQAGYFGTTILVKGFLGSVVRICSYKGKGGSCYDTGKRVRYRGSARAVLDDDHHLISGTSPVCEKTAQLFHSRVYQAFVEVSPGDSEKIARLSTNPILFSCDTFEHDVTALAHSFSESPRGVEKMDFLFYPGPFRLLILTDGTIVRRGKISSVSKDQARKLAVTDGCSILDSKTITATPSNDSFPLLFQRQGARCLLESGSIETTLDPPTSFNLLIFKKIPDSFKHRVEQLIKDNENYLILTGSDPWDVYGCCPSDDVGSANRLVEAGVFQMWPTAQAPDACPCTVYAFAGEIEKKNGKPVFTHNEQLRKSVFSYLQKKGNPLSTVFFPLLKWLLLGFVTVSIGYGIMKTPRNFLKRQKPDVTISLDSLSLDLSDGIYILYFYFEKPCPACKGMKEDLDLIFSTFFKKEIDKKRLTYKTIIIDRDKDSTLVNIFRIVQSTLILSEVKGRNIIRFKKVEYDVWRLLRNEKDYIKFTKKNIYDFLKGKE